MIIHDVPQGSPEWHALRRGIVTTSELTRMVTPAKLDLSGQATGYMHELLAEYYLGEDCSGFSGSAWTDRGSEMEDEAADWYAFTRDADLERVGFIVRDDGMVGTSLDRFIGDDGDLEIKVPSAKVHVGYMLDPASLACKYRLQVQGQLWISERQWCDLVSYNPTLPPVVVRIERDEDVIERLRVVVDAFVEQLAFHRKTMEELGCEASGAVA